MLYEQRLKKGRGSGEGSNYQPWISIHDFPSHGTVARIKGWKTNRVHHFLSKYELQYFFLLEWADTVIDIREQYPLLDVSATLEIAESANIIHPYDKKSGFPYVLTSDFFITTTQGFLARTIKMSKELENKRILEKLEIERRYWSNKGISWQLVTEKEINYEKAKNIEWIHFSKTLQGIPYDDILICKMIFEILELYARTDRAILEICNHIDNLHGVRHGTG